MTKDKEEKVNPGEVFKNSQGNVYLAVKLRNGFANDRGGLGAILLEGGSFQSERGRLYSIDGTARTYDVSKGYGFESLGSLSSCKKALADDSGHFPHGVLFVAQVKGEETMAVMTKCGQVFRADGRYLGDVEGDPAIIEWDKGLGPQFFKVNVAWE